MIDNLNTELVAMAAMRYALGRSSYIVSEVIAFIRNNIKEPVAREKFINEIEQTIDNASLYQTGFPHRQEWLTLVEELKQN
jgi:predicted AAA+ superfamily ATPase